MESQASTLLKKKTTKSWLKTKKLKKKVEANLSFQK